MWLAEYKVVYGDDDTRATREAHSQLKEYSCFLHTTSKPGLLAVFSAAVSEERIRWLHHEGVESVWFHEGAWRGTGPAVDAGLATSAACYRH